MPVCSILARDETRSNPAVPGAIVGLTGSSGALVVAQQGADFALTTDHLAGARVLPAEALLSVLYIMVVVQATQHMQAVMLLLLALVHACDSSWPWQYATYCMIDFVPREIARCHLKVVTVTYVFLCYQVGALSRAQKGSDAAFICSNTA